MDWSDVVEPILDAAPRRVARVLALVILVLLVMPGNPGMAMLRWFADIRAEQVAEAFALTVERISPATR